MSTGIFIVDLMTYDDTGSTNDPYQSILRWRKESNVTGLNYAAAQNLVLATGNHTIGLPSTPLQWVYIETDQTVNVRFDGSVTDDVVVSPSVAGTKDGMFLKRGAFASLVLNVPGATSANVTVFAAY